MSDQVAHYPGRPPIDAYGDGGFRFAEMSHKGSILMLPSGVYAWDVSDLADARPQDFTRIFDEPQGIEFVILGTGPHFIRPAPAIRSAFEDAAIGLEPMHTGAAARTYNVLLAEGRAVAAVLIAVADPN